jgi:hypothetical protein
MSTPQDDAELIAACGLLRGSWRPWRPASRHARPWAGGRKGFRYERKNRFAP